MNRETRTRREFLETLLKSAAALGSLSLFPGVLRGMDTIKYDLVILGGRCIDPYSGFDQIANVGIRDGRIETISPDLLTGEKTLDAKSLVVSPGFIDVLADNTRNPVKTYTIFEKYKVTDGVTTALQMHGGTENAGWYYKAFSELPHWTNFGASTKIMSIRPMFKELKQRIRRVEECLDEGALGVSMSPEYQPLPFDEMVDYARIAQKYTVPVFIHTRFSSRERELEGVAEAIRMSELSGAHVHIDHLHSTGGTFHMEEALEMISRARDKGLGITTCVYPYDYWATYLHSKRFDKGWQNRYGLTYSDLVVVGTGERLNEKSFSAKRKQYGVLVAVPPGTMNKEKILFPALREDFVYISSDGGIESEPRANNHPRGAGTFATAIHEGLAAGLTLSAIIKKMTYYPARLIGLKTMQNRGMLFEGSIADLTVFNPATVNGTATVSNPNQFSDGIVYVVVNGKLAVKNIKLINQSGRAVRSNFEG